MCVNHKGRRNPKRKESHGSEKSQKFLLVSQISSHNQNYNNN